jgi:hypothetical protein
MMAPERKVCNLKNSLSTCTPLSVNKYKVEVAVVVVVKKSINFLLGGLTAHHHQPNPTSRLIKLSTGFFQKIPESLFSRFAL